MTDNHSSSFNTDRGGLRSPLYGTATFTSLSPASPSIDSYSSRRSSYITDDHSDHTLADSNPRNYDDLAADIDNDSFDDSAEVEAALNVDDQISQTEEALSSWGRSPLSSTASRLSGTSSPFTSTQTTSYLSQVTSPFSPISDRATRVLSTITERTEQTQTSRPLSGPSGIFAGRPALPTITASSEVQRRSVHERASTEPTTYTNTSTFTPTASTTERSYSPRPLTGRRAGELIAFFEDRSSSPTITSTFGHTRSGSAPTGPRSPSPYLQHSTGTHIQTIASALNPSTRTFTETTPTYSLSRPTSPSKTARSMVSSLSPSQSASQTGPSTATGGGSSLLSPPPRTTGPSEARVRTPLSSVRHIVTAWKDRAPTLDRSTSPSGPRSMDQPSSLLGGEGFFSLRRRASRDERRRVAEEGLSTGLTSTTSGHEASNESSGGEIGQGRAGNGGRRDDRRSITGSSMRSGSASSLPPPFDIAELGPYTRGGKDPLRIGILWYLNVHAPSPYRWQKCQAVLYPTMLLLSWIAPGGGRGVVTLDLFHCNEVRSVPSPSHPSARDDIGTIAARRQSHRDTEHGIDLMETLCPFQLLYTDGIERLGAESARERVRWVSAIWDVLDKAAAVPDRSQTRSPTGSVRTIGSISTVNSNASGSSSTRFMPPMDTIPDLPDLPDFGPQRSSGYSSSTYLTVPSTRASDDNVISGGIIHPALEGATREIAPSRSSSLRRTSSLTDLDAEFASALSSSGIYVPTRRRPASQLSAQSSDDAFFSSQSRASNASSDISVTRRVPASAFYALSGTSSGSYITRSGTPTTDTRDYTTLSPSTQVASSPRSLRQSDTNSLPDESTFTGTFTSNRSPESSVTGSTLSRSRDNRRRTPRSRSSRFTQSSVLSGTGESDKENDSSLSYESPSQRTKSSKDSSDNADTRNPNSDSDWSACNTNEWTSLQSRSYTSISYSDLSATPDASRVSSEDPFTTASEGTLYDTARSPTPTPTRSTYSTASLIPTTYGTPSEGPSTEYKTASEPPTEYVTASEPSTVYVTADICSSKSPSTAYHTAECRCFEPEKVSDAEVESLYAPTIPSVISEDIEEEIKPEDIPLPSSVPSVASTESVSLSMSISTPTSLSTASSLSISDGTLMLPTSISGSSLSRASLSSFTISSPSEPSTESTIESSSAPQTPKVIPATPSVPSSVSVTTTAPTSSLPISKSESVSPERPISWGTDLSYDSSPLRATPSLPSLALPDAVDVSFETSFLRPLSDVSGSVVSSEPFMKGLEESDVPESIEETKTPSSTTINTRTITVSALSRTPSLFSTKSSISLSSSILDNASVLEFWSPSTEPSLLPSLTQVRSSPTSELVSLKTDSAPLSPIQSTITRGSPPISLTSESSLELPPLPPSTPSESTILKTPSASISVSLSTPRSGAPSIHSIETIPSEPRENLVEDVRRLLDYLRNLDAIRGGESRDLKDSIGRIEDELKSLNDFVRKKEPTPPTVLRDRSVGARTPVPIEIPARRSLTILSLTPPPSVFSPSIPSSIISGESFMSSHRSDDFSLMSEEEYPRPPTEYTLSPSVTMESLAEPVPEPRSLSIPSGASSPPSSSTPSTVSSPTSSESTVRPVPPPRPVPRAPSFSNLRDLLEELRNRTSALWDGQIATNHMLDELRERRPTVPDNSEVNDRLRRIESLLDTILRETTEDITPSDSSSTDTNSIIRRLLDTRRIARPPTLVTPQPRPARQPLASLDDDWADFLNPPPAPTDQPVQGPPPLVPLIRRASRVPRFGSISPPIFSPIIGGRTSAPPESSSIRIAEPSRPFRTPGPRLPTSGTQRPRQPRTDLPYPFEDLAAGTRPTEGPGGFLPSGRDFSGFTGPDDIDFDRRVRDHRIRRDGGGDGFHNVAAQRPQPTDVLGDPGRSQTAPPLSRERDPWYTSRPIPEEGETAGEAPPAPPPGTFVPVAPISGIPPPFQEMLDLLRQNRLAQTASIDQQREIMRYMRGLNDWLEHDVRDRQNEIRSIGARVDALRDDMARLGLAGTAPAQPIQPGAFGQPPIVIPPPPGPFVVPPGGPPGPPPGGPPVIPGGFPPFGPSGPGFIPQSFTPAQPVIPHGVIPSVTTQTPFVPPRPHLGGRVIPDFSRFPPRSSSSSPGIYEARSPPRPHTAPFVPPPPSHFGPPFQPAGAPQQAPIIVPPPLGRTHIIVESPTSPSVESGSFSSPRSQADVGRRRAEEAVPSVVRVEGAPIPVASSVGTPGLPAMFPGEVATPTQIPLPPSVRTELVPGSPRHPDLLPPQQYFPGPSTAPQQPVIVIPPQLPAGFGQPVPPPGGAYPPVTPSFVPSHAPSRRDPEDYADGPRPRSRSRSHSPRSQHIHIHTGEPGSRSPSRRGRSRSPEYEHDPRGRSPVRAPLRSRRSMTPIIVHRSRSRSPIIIHESRRHSRSPGRVYVRDGSRSRSPIFVQRSRRSRSYSPPPVIVQAPSRIRSRSPTRVLVTGRSRSESRSPPRVVFTGSRRSRSRSPTRVVLAGSRRSRSRSRSPTRVVIAGTSRRSRSRSRSPTRVVVTGTSRRSRSRSRSPTRVVVTGASRRSRSRSRSPTRVVLASSRRSRSRSRSPTRVVVAGSRRSRSRSRSPTRVVVTGSRRSRSRSPRQVVVTDTHRSRPRSRSSPRIVVADPRRSRSRSRSPTRVVVTGSRRSRSRSRSPTRVVVPGSRRSRSRSPTRVLVTGSRRSRSRSPTRVVVAGSRRSRSPERVFVTGSRRSRSPERVLVTGSRRSRSRSPQRVLVAGSRRSRSRSPERVFVTGSRRSRSRSPTRVITTGSRRARSRSHSPVLLGDGSRRARSRSPRVLLGSHRGGSILSDRPSRRSRTPSPIHIRVPSPHRPRSRSPEYEHEPGRSRSPTRIFAGTRGSRSPSPEYEPGRGRSHRPTSYSPSRFRTASRVPTERVPSHRAPSHRRPDFDEEDEGLPGSRSPRRPVLPYDRPRSPVPGVSRRESPTDDRRRPRRVDRRPSLAEREEPHELRSRLRSSSPTFVPLEGSQAHRTPPQRFEHSPTLSYDEEPVIPPRPSAHAPSAIPIQRSDQHPVPSHVRAPAQDGSFFRPGEMAREPGISRPPTVVPIGPTTGRERSPPPSMTRYSPPITEAEGPAGAIRSRRPTGRGHSPPPTRYSPPITEAEGPAGAIRSRRPTGREHSPPPSITRYSPPITEAEGPAGAIRSRRPTVREHHTPPPGVSRYTPPPIVPIEADQPSHIPGAPIPHPSSRRGYAPAPPSTVEDQIRHAGDEPIIPHVMSARHPLPEPPGGVVPTAPRSEYAYGDQPEAVPVPAPAAPTMTPGPPHTTQAFARRPESIITARPLAPSGPGDLAFEDAERARQEAFQEHQQHWTDLAREAEDAEERREQYFREHEEERDRIFEDNENRRDLETQQRRDEVFRSLEDRLAIPPAPPAPIASRPPSVYTAADGGAPEEGAVSPTERESIFGPSVPGAPPQPTPVVVPPEAFTPQLNEILGLLRAQQSQMADTHAAEEERRSQQAAADDERSRLAQEQEERIRALEADLARAREELEQERGTRRMEELERADQERAENNERDQAFRDQLNDITTLLQQQADQCEDKKVRMEERWDEKMRRREGKDVKNDKIYDMVKQILDERAEEKREREELRAQEAERPTIEQVLEELHNQQQTTDDLIKKLTADLKEELTKQAEDFTRIVKESSQEMVQYNVTGYIDEFSKALAGEIRILLGEVGRLHELKRTLQYELGALLKMKSKYGPMGEFDPEWKPELTFGPIGPQPPDAPAPPPPGPQEPPPPTKPAWRNIYQRPSRKRRGGAPPQSEPPLTEEPPPPRIQSWATWQPNPQFAPTPPPQTAEQLLVPPPQERSPGLFGPRSPHGTFRG